ncbi:hypothetical protein ACLOJK_028332 [Asimina triloba]
MRSSGLLPFSLRSLKRLVYYISLVLSASLSKDYWNIWFTILLSTFLIEDHWKIWPTMPPLIELLPIFQQLDITASIVFWPENNMNMKPNLASTHAQSTSPVHTSQLAVISSCEVALALESLGTTTVKLHWQPLPPLDMCLLTQKEPHEEKMSYTAFSELLPLIAAGTLPLVKLKRISQAIDTGTQTVVNTATFSSPFATFSFSASASFEVRSPSRVQVQFREGTFPPPEISPTINLPENIDLFGQKINLLPVQRSLSPLQEVVANISRIISGQPPLKVPIPGDRAQSFLVTTYLDEDLRISRGDGGLFVLVKEGSPLLEEQ